MDALNLPTPIVRLSLCGNASKIFTEELKPSCLVSFIYLKNFLENRKEYIIKDWVLDSGAFSAYNSGIEIDLQEYIELCKELQEADPLLTEIYSLDVIGDWKASHSNTEKMWEAGIEAIPCYHYGEPEHVLTSLAEKYPKIALGGVAYMRGPKKAEWATQCFARVWPKKIHGFGFGAEKSIMTIPFHSTDSTNWRIWPEKWGGWGAFKGARLNIRKNHPLSVEVEYMLAIERRAQSRWGKTMETLEQMEQEA